MRPNKLRVEYHEADRVNVQVVQTLKRLVAKRRGLLTPAD